MPNDADGEMTKEEIVVTYYYKKIAGGVVINHIDIATGKQIVDEQKLEGYVGETYETEAKTFANYKLVKEKYPEKAKGEYTEEEIKVTYYYESMNFNLKIDKTIDYITVNGTRYDIKGELGKAEINRKDLSSAKVEVVYLVKVTNDSELPGKATVQENIPAGMKMEKANNPEWEIGQTTAIANTSTIYPGQSQTIRVVMEWENGEENVGTITNTADIITTSNEAGVSELKEGDNKSGAEVIIAIGTGDGTYVVITAGLLIVMIGVGVVVWKRVKRED